MGIDLCSCVCVNIFINNFETNWNCCLCKQSKQLDHFSPSIFLCVYRESYWASTVRWLHANMWLSMYRKLYTIFLKPRAWLVHQSSAFHKRMFKLHGKYIINYNHIHIHRTTYTHASTPPPPSPLPLPHAVISALGNWSIHFWSNTERYHKAKAQLSENVRLIFFFRLLVEGPFHHRYRQIGHTGVCAYNLMWF